MSSEKNRVERTWMHPSAGQVSSYFEVTQNGVVFNTSDQNDNLIVTAEWAGVKLPQGGSLSSADFVNNTACQPDASFMDATKFTAKSNQSTIEIYKDNTSSDGYSVKLNGGASSINDKTVDSIFQDMNSYIRGYFCDLSKRTISEDFDNISANMAPTSSRDRENRVMNTICYTFAIGVTIWPIGTLILGPTVVGCVVWYAAGGGSDERRAGGRRPLPTYEM